MRDIKHIILCKIFQSMTYEVNVPRDSLSRVFNSFDASAFRSLLQLMKRTAVIQKQVKHKSASSAVVTASIHTRIRQPNENKYSNIIR